MSMPGLPEMIIIFAVLFLLFGAKKLPQLGGALGESIKNFKKGINDEPKKLEKETANEREKSGAEGESKKEGGA
jgi:sec-independent protein translocase protein TatA